MSDIAVASLSPSKVKFQFGWAMNKYTPVTSLPPKIICNSAALEYCTDCRANLYIYIPV